MTNERKSVFLSYNHKDQILIDPVAQRLAAAIGQERVFYDQWSIQPGDGLIGKMSDGLGTANTFFWFVSQNSLNSEMVKLEWQNALIGATQGSMRFVPVRIDGSVLPPIVLNTVYIDMFQQGFETALRQIIDVAEGRNIYQPGDASVQNIIAVVKGEDFEIRAQYFMEPHSSYMALVTNHEEYVVSVPHESMYHGGPIDTPDLRRLFGASGHIVRLSRPTSPGFPVTIRIKSKNPTTGLEIPRLMREVARDMWAPIPLATEIDGKLLLVRHLVKNQPTVK